MGKTQPARQPEQRLATRRTLFPTPSQIFERDHNQRVLRQKAPIPLDALDTSGQESRWGMHDVVHFAISPKDDAPMPIKATLGPDGKPAMKDGFVIDISRKEVRMRDYLTPQEAAALLNLSASHVRSLVRDGELPAFRPAKKDGEIRIYVQGLRKHMQASGMSEEHVQTIEKRISDITRI